MSNDIIIKGLFNNSNEEEAKLISNLHQERIKISSNVGLWYILDLTKTVGDFTAENYENDTYDFLYNEEIVKMPFQGRIYMPPLEIPAAYIVPEFVENLGIFGISEIGDKVEIEINLKEIIEISQNIKYAEKFNIINLTANKVFLFEDDNKLYILDENDNVIKEFNSFEEFYNQQKNDDEYFVEKIYSKNIAFDKIILNKTEILPNILYNIDIIDKNYENISTQIVPKIGDLIKIHTNKIYEVQEVYPLGMRLWNYIAIKLICKRKALTNVYLTEEDYQKLLLNFKENKF